MTFHLPERTGTAGPPTVVVVGGGTAGWLSAVCLAAAWPASRVTLVEPERGAIIGVGEATVPSLQRTLARAGIDERRWMAACDATFKLAIRFEGWRADHAPFWHPFGRVPRVGDARLGDAWATLGRAGNFARDCLPALALCEAGRAPLPWPPRDDGGSGHAWHLDSELFGRFLRTVAEQRGVARRASTVRDVQRDGDRVVALQLDDGALHADLWVDATGFASVLLGAGRQAPWTSFAAELLCDRAVVGSVPSARAQTPPYTTATTMAAGWRWRIPLRSRDSYGYVHAGAYVDWEQAEAELRAAVPGLGPLRRIPFRSGHAEAPWRGNVVGVGLAAGFIEPLESTGIHLIELGIAELIRHVADPAAYNRAMVGHLARFRDFVLLHYALAGRDDTAFWRDARAAGRWTPSLRARLGPDLSGVLGTDEYSWLAIVDGLGHPVPAPTGGVDAGIVEAALKALHRQVAASSAVLPSHDAWLDALHGPTEAAGG